MRLPPHELLAALALLCGCTSAPAPTSSPSVSPSAAAPATDEASAPEPSLDERDGQFVLVWFDAELHRAPDDPTPLRAYDFGATPRNARPGQVHVGRRLAVRGPWIRIGGVSEWIDAEYRSLHCIGSDVFDGRGLDVAVWVHERDLAPVLTEALSVRHADGTLVALRPGVPIVAGRPWVDGYSLPVDVPDTKLGWAYAPMDPSSNFEPQLDGGSLVAARSLRAALGGQPVPWTQPVWDYSEVRLATLFSTPDGRRLVYEKRCGELVLEVEGEFEALPPGGVLGGLASGRAAQPAGAVRAGTPLVWPDESPAGVVSEDIVRVEFAPSSEPLTCVALAVGRQLKTEGYREDRARVCVRTDAIEASSLP